MSYTTRHNTDISVKGGARKEHAYRVIAAGELSVAVWACMLDFEVFLVDIFH